MASMVPYSGSGGRHPAESRRQTTLKSVDTDEIETLVARVRGRMDLGKLSSFGWVIRHPGQARILV